MKSPFTPKSMASSLVLQDVQRAHGEVVWLERRGGRGTLVRWTQAAKDLTGDHDVRAQVGYGGGEFALGRGFVVYVAEGRLWRLELDAGLPTPLTPAFGQPASPAISQDGSSVAYVHSDEGIDRILLVPTTGRDLPGVLAEGADFYMQPTWSPDGKRLSWVEWDFPNMPWDGGRLILADYADGSLQALRVVAGNEHTPVFQPLFSLDARYLFFLQNPAELDQLIRFDLASGETRVLWEGVLLEPAWKQGQRSLAFGPGGLYLKVRRDGGESLLRLDPEGGKEQEIATGSYQAFAQLHGDQEGLVFLPSSPLTPSRVVAYDGDKFLILRYAEAERAVKKALSHPYEVHFPGPEGKVFGIYYPPLGDHAKGAVINVHGGPTSHQGLSYNPQAQFLATRGYAYLELNYRGSTGYGRAYREALYGRWGVADVEDAVAAAGWIKRRSNQDRVAIMGGSAGGYTTLMALATYPGVFRAGISLFGVTDLFLLARDTHKFETRYTDHLVGPLPESAATYRARSPLGLAKEIRDPLYVFQGEEDRVVPKNQAEELVRILKVAGMPYRYKLYPGEGHGWRRPETIEDFYQELERFLEAELVFS